MTSSYTLTIREDQSYHPRDVYYSAQILFLQPACLPFLLLLRKPWPSWTALLLSDGPLHASQHTKGLHAGKHEEEEEEEEGR